MNITINIAGALMFVALLAVACAVLGYSIWGVVQVREMSERYREQLREEGYQNALRDVMAFMFTESADTVGGSRELRQLNAKSVTYWIKNRIWREVEKSHTRNVAEDKEPTP